jgi:hypothetical protein
MDASRYPVVSEGDGADSWDGPADGEDLPPPMRERPPRERCPPRLLDPRWAPPSNELLTLSRKRVSRTGVSGFSAAMYRSAKRKRLPLLSPVGLSA